MIQLNETFGLFAWPMRAMLLRIYALCGAFSLAVMISIVTGSLTAVQSQTSSSTPARDGGTVDKPLGQDDPSAAPTPDASEKQADDKGKGKKEKRGCCHCGMRRDFDLKTWRTRGRYYVAHPSDGPDSSSILDR